MHSFISTVYYLAEAYTSITHTGNPPCRYFRKNFDNTMPTIS